MKIIEDIKNLIKYQKAKKRLMKIFPDADRITYLKYMDSTLFNTELEDYFIAIKQEKNNYHIYEEKDREGILKTELIDIEYTSTISYVIAMKIKEIIEKYKGFFQVFLSEYKSIKLDSSLTKTDESFLINDYELNDFLKFRSTANFIERLLSKYNLSSEYIFKIIDTLANKNIYKDYKISIDELNDVESFIYYLLSKEDYEGLKDCLLNINNFQEYKTKFLEDNCYKYLSRLLETKKDEFITENADYIKEALDYNAKNFNASDALKLGLEEPVSTEEVEKFELMKHTMLFLKQIDPTGNVLAEFKKLYDSGRIIIWNLSEEERVKEEYKEFFDENNPLKKTGYYSPTKGFINLPLTNLINGVITLVHEFFHYYSYRTLDKVRISSLDEIISIYYETRVCDYLVDAGFNEEEVRKLSTQRKSLNALNDTANGLSRYLYLMDIKKSDGEVTEENIMTEEEIKNAKTINPFIEAMMNGLNMSKEEKEEFHPTDEHIIKGKVCKEMIKKLEDYSFFYNLQSYISYSLGTYIANTQRSKEMDNRMYTVANYISNPYYSDTDLLNIIRFGTSPKLSAEELQSELSKILGL